MSAVADQNCRFGMLKVEVGGLGCTTGAGAGFRLGVVTAKLGKLCSSGGAPTKPARLVKESRGLAGTEDDDHVGHGDAGAGWRVAPATGRLGE